MLQIICTSDRTCTIGFRSEGGSEDASKVCGLSPQRREPSVAKVGGLQISQTGTYQLGLRAADWAQWTLDGRVVVENSTLGVDVVETATLDLDQGLYELRIRYKDSVQSSRLHLLWRPPGQEVPKAIPSQHLWPSRTSALRPRLEEPAEPLSVAGLR